jgi:hypothetical protein
MTPFGTPGHPGARRGTRAGVVGVALLCAAVLGACSSQTPSATAGAGSTAPTAVDVPTAPNAKPGSSARPSTQSPASGTSPSASQPTSQETPGSINDVVPTRPVETMPPVELTDAPVDFGDGVVVTLTSVTAVTLTARQRGEVSGPGVAIAVTLENTGTQPVAIDSVAVNIEDAQGTPGNPMSAAPNNPFTGTLAPSASASAVYTFSVSSEHRDPLSITVMYSPDAPVAHFVGTIN